MKISLDSLSNENNMLINSNNRFSMRIDSCRNCGNDLLVLKLCPDCSQPLHFGCGKCNKFVDDPIHSHPSQKIISNHSFVTN